MYLPVEHHTIVSCKTLDFCTILTDVHQILIIIIKFHMLQNIIVQDQTDDIIVFNIYKRTVL